LPNGCLQQIAANRFSTPQDVIAILLQGFVRPVFGRQNLAARIMPFQFQIVDIPFAEA
jgi:hypothetical protein